MTIPDLYAFHADRGVAARCMDELLKGRAATVVEEPTACGFRFVAWLVRT